MDLDPRQLIGLVVIAAGAGVLAMSYVAAYLIGRGHGRREALLERREAEHRHSGERLAAVEGAVDSIAQSLSRLSDAQRLMLQQQEQVARRALSAERSKPITPA